MAILHRQKFKLSPCHLVGKKGWNAIAIGKNAITDNSQPELGNTYEIVYDERIFII